MRVMLMLSTTEMKDQQTQLPAMDITACPHCTCENCKRLSYYDVALNLLFEMTLERTASHIKVTRPPCLVGLLPWENVNRSTTLTDSTE